MSTVNIIDNKKEVSASLQKVFPLISLVSAEKKIYSLIEKSVLLINQSILPANVINHIDGTPIVVDSSKPSSITRILNQVTSETGILLLDINPSSELDSSKFSLIFSYLEDVFNELVVIIIGDLDGFLKEAFEKIVKSDTPLTNDYHLIGQEPEVMHLFFIISNQIRKNEQWLKEQSQLKTIQAERKELNKYFSEDVIQEILFGSGESKKSASRQSTIMFLDIRNFTGISEKLEPEQVVELLDLLFTDIVDLIFSGKGSVNKFIGDAILATFGCPQSSGNDIENAVRCAINLISALSLFNQVRPPFLTDDISLGIGIATGKVFAGNVGSHRKMEYTVIGDTVNLASRLQDMTKDLSCTLIVDSATYKGVAGKIPFEKTDMRTVRGKQQSLDIYYLPDKYFDSM